MARNPSGRRRRRWWLALAALVLALAALAAWALPWAVGTPPGMRLVKQRADRILAPGSLGFDSLELSWFGPTRLRGFVLHNHQGQPVLSSPRAVWDRNLWQILFDRPRYGTLSFDGATLDVERKADGTVDIYETIKPLITHNPRLDIAIKIDRAKLRFRSPILAEPLRAEQTRLDLRIPPAPKPITWDLQLAKQTPVDRQAGAPKPAQQTLHVSGSFDRWASGPAQNISLDIAGNDWPLALAQGGVAASGRFSGEVLVRRESAHWRMEGRTWIAALDLAGDLLAGDHLLLDRVGGTWALAQQA
ncbi:MAG TPA: hypothetical protein VGY53_08495, partial [Isosphaeraceae bacterium]|nr:hypothetical protein [Isosphaeraceae bacterium]